MAFIADTFHLTPEKSSSNPNVDRAAAHTAAQMLQGAFPWGATREGEAVWHSIFKRLMQIAADGKI